MRIIGITGGVGSGKSQVLSFMEERYNAVICQADQVAWKLQEPGQLCYKKIVAYFGEEILREDKTIDRNVLGSMVFGDKDKMNALNQMVHPEVKQYIRSLIVQEKKNGTPLFVIEAALLLEDHYDEICDEIWYVYTSEYVRRMRLKESRGYSDQKIDAIMASQVSEKVFRENCQITINNSENFEDTCKEIEKVMNQ